MLIDVYIENKQWLNYRNTDFYMKGFFVDFLGVSKPLDYKKHCFLFAHLW